MTTTPNMTLTLATVGGDADAWGTILNAALGVGGIDDHDHTTGKGVKIPSAALKINADVSWSFSGTNYALKDAKAIDFTPVAATAITAYSSALFSNSSDSNNLYFRNSAGVNVKITDGSTLNVSIVGGIGGDYSSIGALLDYDDATDTYRFRQQTSSAVRQYAKIHSADLVLTEYKAAGVTPVPANAVTVQSPAALAASYTITLPSGVPGSTLAVQMAATGALSASNTFASAITATQFHHTSAELLILPGGWWVDVNGTHTRSTTTSGGTKGYLLAASANKLIMPLPLRDGETIASYRVFVVKNTTGSTVTARLYKYDGASETALGSGVSNSTDAPGLIPLAENVSVAVTNGTQYYILMTPSGSVAPSADILLHAQVSYTS